MAKIVGGFLMPHNPLMASDPDAAPAKQKQACMEASATIASRLKELDVDTVVLIGDDHYTMYGPSCIPRCMIGVDNVEGPIEQWLGIERQNIPNNPQLAKHIMQHGFDQGVDWVISKFLSLDHSTIVPIEFVIRPAGEILTIPVYMNSGFAPFISNQRAHYIGQTIGQAVASWTGDERVAILGTGGISHWVGMAEMGTINEAWDKQIIAHVEDGDIESLLALSDEEMLSQSGNGGLEIKNWMCALGAMNVGAMNSVRGELIAYEAITEWINGVAYMELTTP